MGIRIGGIDPVKYTDGLLQVLVQRGILDNTDAEQIRQHARS